MFDQFMKGFQSFKAPQIDTSALVALQKKNVENFTAISQAFGDATQEFTKKSAAFAQANTEAAMSASRDVFSATAPEEKAAKQGELAKKTVATCTKQVKELTELATKSQLKALETMNKHFNESVEDAKNLAKKAA
ncbi:MAG: phasin family protein [Rickettsiales bacterium]|nr:phasin family protein [Rickettsiales bacterium]